MSDEKKPTIRTRLVQKSRPAKGQRRPVNPPVVRASTVLYENVATLRDVRAKRPTRERAFSYATNGTPTVFALEDMIADLEGGPATTA